MPHNSATARLAASRTSRLCDEQGILPAITGAMRRGEITGYDDPEDYLTDVLEGRAPDDISKFGWNMCASIKQCARAGRCLRKS